MTKQEQTKQMLKILCDKFQCSAIDRSYMAKSCRQCEDIVKAIHEAGYGDISEYKAEIERLKAEFKQLETNAEILARGVRDLNHENYELTEKVKQAQIDILNKLKDSYGLYYLSAFGVKERMLADILNPMMEELKK